MNHRHITAALAAVATAGLAACGSSSAPSSSATPSSAIPSSGTLNVWLMSGSAPVALTGSGVGQTCNSSGVTTTTTGTWVTGFEQANPGWTVDITCQGWSGIVAKVTSALASSSPPDALEMGNTQVTGFADTGGLADLSSDSFPNQSTWLAGLKGAGTYQDKLFGIPYYAGGRLVIYNTAMFTAAGITSPPTTMAQLITDGQAIQTAEKSTANFCSLWLPGESWYQIFSFLADANTGAASADPIASYANGKWTGTLEFLRQRAGAHRGQEHAGRDLDLLRARPDRHHLRRPHDPPDRGHGHPAELGGGGDHQRGRQADPARARQ